MPFKNKLLFFVGFLCLLAGSAINAENTMPGKDDCVMGVFPFLSPQRLESIFAPIAAELSTVLGCSLRYQSASSFETFVEKLKRQEFFIAFVQPFDYVRIVANNGYLPLVACCDSMAAVIVTLPDSNINTVHQLKGKTIALPPPVAAISYLSRTLLKQAGIDPEEDVTLLYTKNQASCIQQVLIGIADACGVSSPALRMFQKKTQRQLKQIAVSPSIPPSLFVIRDNVDEALIDKLQQKMLNIKLSSSAQMLFGKEGSTNPFRLVIDGEYDVVRDYRNQCTVKDSL